jgi:urease accessory protein
MELEALVGVLQLSDGLFPAGAYAHSFGLETLVQEARVRDAAGVRDFLHTLIESGAGPSDAVAVAEALRAASEPTLSTAFGIDAWLDALKPALELREASRQMGRQTLRVAAALWPEAPAAALFRAVDARETPGHHALAFGFAAQAAGADAGAAAAGFLYSTAAAVVGAALRLLPLGQLAGQTLLAEAGPAVARLASLASRTPLAEAWCFTPALEAASMRHARLDARLFRS